MADKAYITPNVLKWARESARMTEETTAAKVSVKVEKIKEWEAGTSQPTIRQAQTLAKAYKRPFAFAPKKLCGGRTVNRSEIPNYAYT
ncbi:helix-turn-helix domain-containing protein [Cyclobacterium plantarum]|uniref:helix-turn-helix domain-containing protein n=1 Tax=Cyclobacterium plantarum TaxID=2716263 RepID=UPI003F7091A8